MLLSKTFILTEVDDLIFDLIILMIVIALLDNAFFSKVTFGRRDLPHSGPRSTAQLRIQVAPG